MFINDLHFYETCGGCPEQYDVYDGNDFYDGNDPVGYVSLRHGSFTVSNADQNIQLLSADVSRTDSDGIFSEVA